MGDRRPAWLGEDALPWIEALLLHARTFDGRPWKVWRAWRAAPSPVAAPATQRDAVLDALEAEWARSRPLARPHPRQRRLALYAAAAGARREGRFDRAQILGTAGDAELFADLPAERRMSVAAATPATALLAAANLRLARRALRKAVVVKIVLSGASHDVLRVVRLQRLLAVARRTEDGLTLEITGVFTLFRRTALYGKAFASLLAALARCDAFVLRAELAGGGTVRLQTGDPIAPPGPPQRFDSKLEAKFAKDVSAIGGWGVLREPEPLEVGDAWVFPDFALWRAADPSRCWLVEIIGFWTPEYLQAKLARLARSGRTDLLLVIDRRLGCAAADLPAGLPVVWFDRQIDAAAVLARLAPPTVRLGLGDYFLDFAGRQTGAIHDRLAALKAGDTLSLVARGGAVYLDAAEGEVAALSVRAAQVWRPRLAAPRPVQVVGLISRTADETGERWRDRLVVPRWRVPLVELATD